MPSQEKQLAAQLLNIVRDLAIELHPEESETLRVGLDSHIDHDLGLDSLAQAELLVRLERAFKIHLSEELLRESETLRDILAMVLQAETGKHPLKAADFRAPVLGPAEAAPSSARTLTEVLDWHVNQHPKRPHVLLLDENDRETTLTYGGLAKDARAIASGLIKEGVEPGDHVALMFPTGEAFFKAFFAILYAGGVPVPIYPPIRLSQIEEHLNRQASILRNAKVVVLITVPEAVLLAKILQSQVEGLRAVKTVATLLTSKTVELEEITQAERMALLQYTSGSTSDPKGVMLTHANLLTNIRAMGQAVHVVPSDVFVSWLPLYHDMGLIGAWLGSLYFAVPAVIMSPLTFLTRPERWLWAIHHYKGTLSAAPNFGFELCIRKIQDDDIEGLDLSSLRLVTNGAEPVSPDTIRRFAKRFSKYGFRAEAMTPAYGLAENSVGLAFSMPGKPPVFDRIKRTPLTRWGKAVPAKRKDTNALEFVACGHPVKGHEVRIVDATGREVGERHEGKLQFRGPSSTTGYFQNEAKNNALFKGSWLESGDLAYIASGNIFLTDRVKDIIIRAGRNIYPHEVEEVVGNIEGIRKGCVAVVGTSDTRSATEKIIVIAETRQKHEAEQQRLAQRIETATMDLLGMPPDKVVLVPPHTVPKTSSGKIRRSLTRELFEKGQLKREYRALWWQLTRLVVSGFFYQLTVKWHVCVAVVYASYWWTVLSVLGAITWLLMLVLPFQPLRWKVLRVMARTGLWLMGIPVEVQHRDRLPATGGILVANHSSYIDGLVLTAVLPGEMVFVAKKEFKTQWIAGTFLKRIRAVFVERKDPKVSVEDRRKLAQPARTRQRLVFFPEGTLGRTPGLLSFHLGAFVTAAELGSSVVPITIRGTRSILRGTQWFPRKGRVSVTVGKPFLPKGRGFEAAIRLRDRARKDILSHCQEPDLSE